MNNTPLKTPDFKLLFESVPGLYLVLDPSLHIIAASNAYLQATKTRRADILEKHLFEIFPDNPDDPASDGVRNTRASLDRVLESRQPDVMVVQRHDIRKPESEGGGFEVRYWSPVNSPVLNPDGSLACIIHRVEDVTEFVLLKQEGIAQSRMTDELRQRAVKVEADLYARSREAAEISIKLKQANKELASLNEKARELDELKSQFFANVSHELRTPLTLILGPVTRQLDREELDGQARHDLQIVQRNARYLERHVNDLLDIAKLEAGRMLVHYLQMDLAAFTRRIGSQFELMAADRNIRYAVNTPDALPAQVDEEKVERILFNLLSNAFKFTPDGGAISLFLEQHPEHARICLQDNGRGVPEPLRKIIFDRFRQGEGGMDRSHGGTGLGLSIVREFVSLHKGTVSVEKTPGGGATFIVELPIVAPAGTFVAEKKSVPEEKLAQAPLEELQLHPVVSEPGISGRLDQDYAPRILIVEDNADMNVFLADVLGQHYRIMQSFNGEEGLRKALANPPDLVLADIMMPVMSGDRMVEAMRRHHLLDDVPIVILTAKADEALRIGLLRHGVQDYIHKPFSVKELLARVRGLLEQRQRADSRLRESEEKYRTLFESIDEGFCVFEMLFDATGAPVDYRWLETNPAFERHTGLVDAIGKTARELVPNLESYWVEIYGLVAESGKSQRFIHQSPAMGRWFEVEAFRIGSPELRRVALLFNDITERKQAEQRLLESEEKYRSLMEQSTDMMFLHDLQGHFLEVNQAAVSHTGYSREALLNMTAFDIHSGQPGRDELLQMWQKWRIGQTVTVEATHVRKDGSRFAAEVKAGKIHFGGYDYILALARDITPRKVTEDALQRSVVQYDALFNQMTEGLVLFDPEGNLLDMNPAALAIHGFNKVDNLRQNLHALAAEVFELFDLEGNPLALEKWPIGRVLRGETFDKYEVIVRSRNSDKKWIGSYGGTPVKDPDGRLLMAIVTLRDVTHLKRSEKALQLLNETLEQKVAERTEVAENRAKQLQSLAVELLEAEERERQRISSLLHEDLQQLIASARMQVQLALEKADPGPILENVHRLLGDSIEKSRRLSQELSPPLLYQFGIDAGLRWLVRHMEEQFGLKIQLKIEVTSQIKEMPLQIFLFRAAKELLFNIVKHSGVKIADVRLYGSDEGITLSVRDRGEGFSLEILDSFDRKIGLGLLSLRERAHAIGGNLEIESASGQGSRFTLTIPISLVMVNVPEKLAQVAIPSPEIIDEQKKYSDSETIRVLFVDDHKVMRQGLIGIIADQPGIRLAGEAANGEEALELARQLSPDVIVMDVSMPKMDGVEATRRIKAEMPEARIIGLSMFDDEDVTRRMRQAGADGFVSKSESSSELLKTIYEVAEKGMASLGEISEMK